MPMLARDGVSAITPSPCGSYFVLQLVDSTGSQLWLRALGTL